MYNESTVHEMTGMLHTFIRRSDRTSLRSLIDFRSLNIFGSKAPVEILCSLPSQGLEFFKFKASSMMTSMMANNRMRKSKMFHFFLKYHFRNARICQPKAIMLQEIKEVVMKSASKAIWHYIGWISWKKTVSRFVWLLEREVSVYLMMYLWWKTIDFYTKAIMFTMLPQVILLALTTNSHHKAMSSPSLNTNLRKSFKAIDTNEHIVEDVERWSIAFCKIITAQITFFYQFPYDGDDIDSNNNLHDDLKCLVHAHFIEKSHKSIFGTWKHINIWLLWLPLFQFGALNEKKNHTI